MQSLQTITNSYSNSNLTKLNNSNSYSKTEDILDLLNNLPDVIPSDGYGGFYVNQFKRLGYKRFMELANKARAGSDTPAKLFCWMLKNDRSVR